MNHYNIITPGFSALVLVQYDHVYQTAPALSFITGWDWFRVVEYVEAKPGWYIQPIIDEDKPGFLSHNGIEYELLWRNGILVRVTKHEPDGESKDIKPSALPAELRRLL